MSKIPLGFKTFQITKKGSSHDFTGQLELNDYDKERNLVGPKAMNPSLSADLGRPTP